MNEVIAVSSNEGRKLKKKFFSVVTAVYNSAPWLECYFSSLIEQSIGFEEHIQVILVDDGSTDESWDMINEYARKYPKNVLCLKKQNGGQASARNLGLNYVNAEWVSFIDSDDFVDVNYFNYVKKFIYNCNFLGKLISCKSLYFREKDNIFDFNHVLSYRFNKNFVVNLLNESQYIQLSASTCIFKCDKIIDFDLKFSDKIRPSFEDAHFVNIFLLKCKNFEVAFLDKPTYFYRKRSVKDSTIDTSWHDDKKYSDELYYGCYDLLRNYKDSMGFVPGFIQNTVVYHVHWFCNAMYNNKYFTSIPRDIIITYFKIMKEVFCLIDVESIMYSKLPMLTLQSRALMLGVFKNYKDYIFPCIIVGFSSDKKKLSLLQYSYECSNINVVDNNGNSIMLNKKLIKRFGFGKYLFTEHRILVDIDGIKYLRCQIDGVNIPIVSRKRILDFPAQKEIIDSYFFLIEEIEDERIDYYYLSSMKQYEQYEKCWILMDRIEKADDNAEHLYRWIRDNYSEKKIYFVLSKNSSDWTRLKQDGFALVEYGSKEHCLALFRAEWLISSHADENVIDYLKMRDRYGIPSYKLAFLQHGVIKDDLSSWLNQKNFDLFITSAESEYNSVISGNYKFSHYEVELTGLPRHDALAVKSYNKSVKDKCILLSPTWRKHLKFEDSENLSPTEKFEVFLSSDYYTVWKSLISSDRFIGILKENNARAVFFPHPEINPYINLFGNSECVDLVTYKDVNSIQDILAHCCILVTDYSSIAFEGAIISKPIVYYHFVENPPFFESHLYSKGYYDYKKDGFGPIANSESELCSYIEEMFLSEFSSEHPYRERARNFFKFQDTSNCLRVYNSIIKRSAPLHGC